MKKILLLQVCLILSYFGFAQTHKNSLTIGVAKAWLRETGLTAYGKSMLNMPSVRYERRVYKGFGVAIACTKWMPNFSAYESSFSHFYMIKNKKVGDLFERDKYWYVDVIATYGINWHKNIDIKFGLGLSNARGKDYRITRIVVFPTDAIVETEENRGSHFGPILEVNPVANLFNNHMSIGPYIDLRYYPSLDSRQFDLGLRLSYNFL